MLDEIATMDIPDGDPVPAEYDPHQLIGLVDLAYQTVEHPERLRSLLAALAAAIGVESVLLVATVEGERRLLADGHVTESLETLRKRAGPGREGRGTRTVPLGGGLELVLDREQLPAAGSRLLQRLVPHVARALRLTDRLASVERSGLHSEALERLTLAVALLDERGHVLFLNRAARRVLSVTARLALEEGHLVPRHPVSRALLESLVEQVACISSSGRRRGGGRLRLEHGEGPPLDLVLTAYDGQLEGVAVSCAAFFSEPNAPMGLAARLAEITGLDADEAQAFLHIVEGGPSPTGEAADVALGCSIRSLYRKLGSTRRRDLVELLLRPPGALFLACGADPTP